MLLWDKAQQICSTTILILPNEIISVPNIEFAMSHPYAYVKLEFEFNSCQPDILVFTGMNIASSA